MILFSQRITGPQAGQGVGGEHPGRSAARRRVRRCQPGEGEPPGQTGAKSASGCKGSLCPENSPGGSIPRGGRGPGAEQ